MHAAYKSHGDLAKFVRAHGLASCFAENDPPVDDLRPPFLAILIHKLQLRMNFLQDPESVLQDNIACAMSNHIPPDTLAAECQSIQTEVIQECICDQFRLEDQFVVAGVWGG